MEDQILEINNVDDNGMSIIKVIGVGGGGGNAVNHMYAENINDVTFLLCNTDRQHLRKSQIPNTICIGEKVTKGLGAGNKPERAAAAAEESVELITEALSDETRMVFVTAGMGGGTGTGAAPVIARIAKSMGILTVGIVTIPFLFEGEKKLLQAIRGVEEMSKHVDAMLVIKNELLRKIYPEMKMSEAFLRADETLTIAARSISELVTTPGIMNLDFNDVHTTLANGGIAIISRGFGDGPDRVNKAIEDALHSPLINTSNFEKASRVLIYLAYSSTSEPEAEVFDVLRNFTGGIQGKFDLIWGHGSDESLGDKVRITILASGFDADEATRGIIEDEDRKKLDYYIGDLIDGGTTFRSETSVIFTEEELDDDSFISMIADTPTLRRPDSIVARYRKASSTKEQLQDDTSETVLMSSTPQPSNEAKGEEPKSGLSDDDDDKDDYDDILIDFGSGL